MRQKDAYAAHRQPYKWQQVDSVGNADRPLVPQFSVSFRGEQLRRRSHASQKV